jgi:signal transduction histidine kinase
LTEFLIGQPALTQKFGKIRSKIMDFTTPINYGLKRIENWVADQVDTTKTDIPESLDYLIIKQVLDNYAKNAENYDLRDLLNKVVNYCAILENSSK